MLIPIERDQIITADYLASIREYYEFRRQGKGYNYEETGLHPIVSKLYMVDLKSHSNIFFGILFEICLFKGIVKSLTQRITNECNYSFAQDKQKYIRKKLISIGFSHEVTIGRYDAGYDFLWKNNNRDIRIDAKVYGSKIINNTHSCSGYHLYVDEDQYKKAGCDIYVQGFIIDKVYELSSLSFYVSGWKRHGDNFRFYPNASNPAYGVKVPNLNDIKELIDHIYNNSGLSTKNEFGVY